MPTADDTPRDVKVPMPEGALGRGFISVTDYLRTADNNQVRVFEVSDSLWAASIGSSQVVLTSEAWRALIGAVQQVLPPARTNLAAVADAAFIGDEVSA